MAAAGTKSVYLIGHSYGGWSVMKLALMLLGDYKVEGLVTIDPISPLFCTPSRILSLLPDPGCQEAPTDVSPADRERLEIGDGELGTFLSNSIRAATLNGLLGARFCETAFVFG